MIVRSFYNARTHEVLHVVQVNQRTHDGCLFDSITGTVVRTRCDQFLSNDEVPLVALRAATEPTCAECREKLRIEAVAAAASAE